MSKEYLDKIEAARSDYLDKFDAAAQALDANGNNAPADTPIRVAHPRVVPCESSQVGVHLAQTEIERRGWRLFPAYGTGDLDDQVVDAWYPDPGRKSLSRAV